MAKFATVGYGHDGRGVGQSGEGYTYIVNNNVRADDVLQVIATSRAGNKFATTAQVKRQGIKTQAPATSQDKPITEAQTGKELGVSSKGVSRETHTQAVRGAVLGKYQQTHPSSSVAQTQTQQKAIETYDSYAKQFLKQQGGGQ